MLSSTYQQASLDRPDCPPARPREPAALAVQSPPARPGGDARHAAVRLGPARRDHAGPARGCGGRPQDHAAGRSTVWSTARACPRSSGPSTSPAPTSRAERRPRTTVPQQALFSMNSPLVIEQARALAARPELAKGHDFQRPGSTALYRRVLARPPVPSEHAGGPPLPDQRLTIAAGPAPATAPSLTACNSSPRCCS